MAEQSIEELRAELERVKKERDDYRAMAADLLKRHCGEDLDELEADLRNWKEHGGIPFEQILRELEAEFGIKL
jgi:hypothetical protein